MTARNPSLDVLRGIAVLMVIEHHYQCPLFPHWFIETGWSGVDLFFVLSGFLISGLLFSELRTHGQLHIRRFLIRRGLKIYPAFYFFIILSGLLVPVVRARYFWIEVFFLQSIIFPARTVWSHTWSLAVEEHFYIALPFLLWLLTANKKLHWLPWISIVLAVACFTLRVVAEAHFPAEFSDIRCDGLFAGVALGYLYHYQRERFVDWSRWPLLPAGVLFLIPVAFLAQSSALRASFTMTANMIGFSLILVWAVTRQLPHTRIIAEIGKYSYSIYLWHLLISWLWGGMLHVSVPGFFAYVFCSIVFGIVTALLIEIPVLRMRERFFPTHAEPLVEQERTNFDYGPGEPLHFPIYRDRALSVNEGQAISGGPSLK
jgi:peptidoglycan/LPS O-acetylase OafA/YrhL